MIQLARHTTIESQRLAAGRRTWPVSIWLAVVGTGALLLLSHLALTALHNGHSGAAGVLALLALLAGVFSGLATRASLARLGWLGLKKHCLILACRAAAGRASACMHALARAGSCVCCIALRLSKLIQARALAIIGNRLLPSVCISPRIISQRPN